MSDNIQSLSPQWWTAVTESEGVISGPAPAAMQGDAAWSPRLSKHLAPEYMALANHALPPSQKITPDTVRVLGEFLDRWREIEKADADFNGYGRGVSHEAAYQLLRNLESTLRSIVPPA
jgi:hypothetical protein